MTTTVPCTTCKARGWVAGQCRVIDQSLRIVKATVCQPCPRCGGDGSIEVVDVLPGQLGLTDADEHDCLCGHPAHGGDDCPHTGCGCASYRPESTTVETA